MADGEKASEEALRAAVRHVLGEDALRPILLDDSRIETNAVEPGSDGSLRDTRRRRITPARKQEPGFCDLNLLGQLGVALGLLGLSAQRLR